MNITIPTTRITATRDELRSRRAARSSRRQLERDLSSYETPAELSEIHAILSRNEGPEAEEIREILSRQHAA
jgi:hypothetical protein